MPWAALLFAACGIVDPPAPVGRDLASLHTPDLVSDVEARSALWPSDIPYPALSVSFSGLTPRDEDGFRLSRTADLAIAIDRAVLEGMSLIRVRDGAIVETEARAGFVDLSGTERPASAYDVYSLVPVEPFETLEEGWYVFRVDLSGLDAIPEMGVDPAEHETYEGRVLYARLYKGSRPMWRHAYAQCSPDDDECLIGVVATEPLAEPVDGTIEVRYEGELVTCDSPESGEYVLQVSCPYTQNNEYGGTVIDVDLVTDAFVGPGGEPLVAGDGVDVRIEREVGYPDPELGLDLVRAGGR